jgi:acetyl-CoA acetyltransferase
MGEAYIVGVGMTNITRHQRTANELGVEACVKAMRDAAIKPRDIEGVITTPHGYMAEHRKFIAQKMADYLQISPRLMMDVDCGGNSSAVGLKAAVVEIAIGRIRSCLVYASQKEIKKTEVNPAEHFPLIRSANDLYDTYQAAYGVIGVMPFYAMAIQRYMHECGVTPEDIAHLAVVLRNHAKANPLAAYRQPITVEEVLGSRLVSPPIHQLESSVIMDGAAAVVLVGEELLPLYRERAVRIAGVGEAHDATSFLPYQKDLSRFPSAGRAMAEALEATGYSIGDIDVAEVYGAFAGVELMLYEELGFFPRGEAPRAVREGKTTHGGEVLINPSGGRLSLGHPTYATPLLEVIEVVDHLRGEAGSRQSPRARVGMVHSEHGLVNGNLVAILDRRLEEPLAWI